MCDFMPIAVSRINDLEVSEKATVEGRWSNHYEDNLVLAPHCQLKLPLYPVR